MVDFVSCLTNLLFFDIPLLYYCINLNLSIIYYLSSADIYHSFGISLSLSTASELFRGYFFVILLAMLLPVKITSRFYFF